MKNNLDDEFSVALAKEYCPVCLKEIDGPIIINNELTKEAADKVKNLHNKVIGYANHICDECKSKLKDGYVYGIGVDMKKTVSTDNPYRNGVIFLLDKSIHNIDGEFVFIPMTEEQLQEVLKQKK